LDKPTVLVVDDNDDLRVLFEEILTDEGYVVLTARSGSEGVALATTCCPTAVTMDVEMPEMDGYEAIRRIRAAGCTPRPFIVCVTAHVGAASRAQAYGAGADDFVAKPISRAELSGALREAAPAERRR
jgi:CheY-like chemotaxis protein